jgi:hypothetical protein
MELKTITRRTRNVGVAWTCHKDNSYDAGPFDLIELHAPQFTGTLCQCMDWVQSATKNLGVACNIFWFVGGMRIAEWLDAQSYGLEESYRNDLYVTHRDNNGVLVHDRDEIDVYVEKKQQVTA